MDDLHRRLASWRSGPRGNTFSIHVSKREHEIVPVLTALCPVLELILTAMMEKDRWILNYLFCIAKIMVMQRSLHCQPPQ